MLATVSRHMLDVTKEGAGTVVEGNRGAVWCLDKVGTFVVTGYEC